VVGVNEVVGRGEYNRRKMGTGGGMQGDLSQRTRTQRRIPPLVTAPRKARLHYQLSLLKTGRDRAGIQKTTSHMRDERDMS